MTAEDRQDEVAGYFSHSKVLQRELKESPSHPFKSNWSKENSRCKQKGSSHE